MAREDLQDLVENAEPELFELNVDGEKFAGEFLFVEILNLSFTGPALPLAFHARRTMDCSTSSFWRRKTAIQCSLGWAVIRRKCRHL